MTRVNQRHDSHKSLATTLPLTARRGSRGGSARPHDGAGPRRATGGRHTKHAPPLRSETSAMAHVVCPISGPSEGDRAGGVAGLGDRRDQLVDADQGRVVVDLDAGGGEVHLYGGHAVKPPDLLFDLRNAGRAGEALGAQDRVGVGGSGGAHGSCPFRSCITPQGVASTTLSRPRQGNHDLRQSTATQALARTRPATTTDRLSMTRRGLQLSISAVAARRSRSSTAVQRRPESMMPSLRSRLITRAVSY